MTVGPHVAIVGSRDFPELALVRDMVRKLASEHPDARVVSGGARGVDSVAEHYAVEAGLMVFSFRPRKRDDGRYEIELVEYANGREKRAPCTDRKTYGSFVAAAKARNRKIVQHATRVEAFTIGSSGTAHTIGVARELGVPVTVTEVSA